MDFKEKAFNPIEKKYKSRIAIPQLKTGVRPAINFMNKKNMRCFVLNIF